jgi:hypothetical protein
MKDIWNLPTMGPAEDGRRSARNRRPLPREFQPNTLWAYKGNVVSKAVVRDATTRIPQKAARRRRDESRANIGGNCLERDEGPGVASKLGDDGIATTPRGSRVCCSLLTGSISRAGEIEATFSWAFNHLAATFFSINASLNTISIAISPNALQETLVRHARSPKRNFKTHT